MSEVHQLGRELSQSTRMVNVSAELEQLAQRSPDGSEHRRDELYRRALIGVYARLAATSRSLDQRAPEREEAAPSSALCASERVRGRLGNDRALRSAPTVGSHRARPRARA